MATIESLGVHTPVALPYLIREGLLPQEPNPDLYQWETSVFNDGIEDVEEEVLATKNAVAWSQGRFLRHVYRFELEGEEVVQALITNFLASDSTDQEQQAADSISNSYSHLRPAPKGPATPGKQVQTASPASFDRISTSRALVVILKTKAHIYFLQGPTHMIDLPFEVERAFTTPRGLVLQRRRSPQLVIPPTPQIPAAPHNSFFSSQLIPSQPSFLESPTVTRSFAGATHRVRPNSQNSSNARLEALFNEIMGPTNRFEEEDNASIYSLTGALSDFGVVSCAVQQQKARISGKTQPGIHVEFEELNATEELLYVSRTDELAESSKNNHGELMLMVTANHELRSLHIWHAWYIDEKSLTELLKQRAAQKAAKLRRRSSFLSGSMGTGATTPAVRHRENTRESFAGAGSMRLAADPAAVGSTRKPTRQEEEAVMASQMDPDYQPAPPQQPKRESRRISSINTDMRTSQSGHNPSFAPAGNRRNTSFGVHDRKSFNHRRSRGSTPGSVFSRSVGPDDDFMEVDSSLGFEDEESVDSVIRHIRATYEAAGTENVFGGVEDGFRCELVARKLHTLPMPSQKPSAESNILQTKVVTLHQTRSPMSEDDEAVSLYVHHRHSQEVTGVRLSIKQRPLWPDLPTSWLTAVPVVTEEFKSEKCTDVIMVRDGPISALLLSGKGLVLPTDSKMSNNLPPQAPYRAHGLFDVQRRTGNQDMGRNRILPAPEKTSTLAHGGVRGAFDEIGHDKTHHRRYLQLQPRDAHINELLGVCQAVLPPPQAAAMRTTWCRAHSWLMQHPNSLTNTSSTIEWVALVASVLSNVTRLMDSKARAALNLSRVAAGNQKSRTSSIGALDEGGHAMPSVAWSWMASSEAQALHLHSSPSSRLFVDKKKDQILPISAALAEELQSLARADASPSKDLIATTKNALKLMLALHVFREEQKLCVLSTARSQSTDLAPVIAQLGSWLGLDSWAYGPNTYYSHEGASEAQWAYVKSASRKPPNVGIMEEPIGIFQWFEGALQGTSIEEYLSLSAVGRLDLTFQATSTSHLTTKYTPRTAALSTTLIGTAGLTTPPATTVEIMAIHGVNGKMLETLPEAVAAPFMEAVARCEREPPTTWTTDLLRLVGREDLELESDGRFKVASHPHLSILTPPRDVHAICQALEQTTHAARTREASRHAVSQLIFSEDRRLVQATSLMHFNSVQVAECPKQPDWTDAYHFEQQRRVMQWVTLRMIALPAGDGMIHYDSQSPLLTEKYHLPGFNSSCLMQPMGHTLTTDRSGLTEEKVNWAYFHAGVSAGLRISRSVKGIDTSWIAFNKPTELTNRHAGLLLALGLNGHLKSLAKWLSFKYLTPKHNMTSVGLLLGLSVSYLGTMDSLITRMLSVHITRMLPPGAAELNVSPVTQTAGLMGIGMLYYNTQHRRMSEIMLSEIERLDIEDPDSGPDQLRDESYRLSAGFALGLINLAKGQSLRGLNGMQLPERLLAIAVGSRPVGAVHVFDRAPAGAIVALALVYMKSGDSAIARKVDIPDTEAQFDHVRPDMLLLRAMAKHVILWNSMDDLSSNGKGTSPWIDRNLPPCYAGRLQAITSNMGKYSPKTSDVPFYNIATGLAWALSLRYAGSGNTKARDEILTLFDCLQSVRGGDSFYYDAKLARATIRRCIDVLALSAATVMAGTGDLKTLRYLRRLHGRTDAETPYGSHLAGHLAIGVLFLGGGTYTLGTSDLAVASLMCAFYPLFPIDVHDNRVHLQAFRHLWVLAAEARCLVVEDIDTHRPIAMPVRLDLRNGETTTLTAPCLLPDLDSIATVQTADSTFWRVTLDFANNPAHLPAFRANQRIFVRRCPATEAHSSAFAATLAALSDTATVANAAAREQIWHAVFTLPIFRTLDKADIELVLPPTTDVNSAASAQADERGTVVDHRLVLASGVQSSDRNALWNLKVLFAWAERAREEQGDLRWIGNEVVAAMEARVMSRARSVRNDEQ